MGVNMRMARVVVLGVGCVAGAFTHADGAAPKRPGPVLEKTPQAHSAPATERPQSPAVEWRPVGRSIERRVIEQAKFGGGGLQVLVVGPLVGNEPEGLTLANRLAEHLAEYPRAIEGTTVTILRDPNPDGRARKTAGNARGVMLNWNFGTSRWRKRTVGRQVASGNEPESEPETRALTDLLNDLRPHRVILLATSASRATIGYSREGHDLAQDIRRQIDATLTPLDQDAACGSFASLAGHDHELATVVLGTPRGQNADRMWAAWRRALLAALANPATKPALEASLNPQESAVDPAAEANSPPNSSTGPGAAPVSAQAATHAEDDSQDPITAPLEPVVRPRGKRRARSAATSASPSGAGAEPAGKKSGAPGAKSVRKARAKTSHGRPVESASAAAPIAEKRSEAVPAGAFPADDNEAPGDDETASKAPATRPEAGDGTLQSRLPQRPIPLPE